MGAGDATGEGNRRSSCWWEGRPGGDSRPRFIGDEIICEEEAVLHGDMAGERRVWCWGVLGAEDPGGK